MIRVARGTEPDALRTARHKRLAAACLAATATGTPPVGYDFADYDVARRPLYDAQFGKCGFCESPTRFDSEPTEHFRPKAGAWLFADADDPDDPTHWAADRYWWLAWTWQNLLFACVSCNNSPNKGNHFAVDGAPLPALNFDLSQETGLLIDPTRDDPLDHVRWHPRNPADKPEYWEWQAHPQSSRGAYTLRILGFDSWDLPLHVTRAIRREVIPAVASVEACLRAGNVAAAGARWQELLTCALVDDAPYVGAKWSSLAYVRDLPGSPLAALPLARPGRHDPPVAVVGLPPAPAPFAQRDWLRLLAGTEREGLLLSLCSVPRTRKELAGLLATPPSTFPKSPTILKALLDALVAGGRLDLNGRSYTAV